MAHLNSLIILFFLSFFTLSSSFDISQVLSQYPEFSTFSNYLTQTQLNDAINSRNPITILAVDNAAIGPLAGKPMDVIQKLLSVHVCLDWYDIPKLQQLNNKFAIITTLYQTSGLATGQTGFLNVTAVDGGAVSFASASDPTRTVAANLVNSVHSEPYSLSVLQVSAVIMPPALLSHAPQSSATPAQPPAASPAPAKPPMPIPAPEPVPVTPAPVQSPLPVGMPAPANAPVPAAKAPVVPAAKAPMVPAAKAPIVPAAKAPMVPAAKAPMVPAGAPGQAPAPAIAPGSEASPADSPIEPPALIPDSDDDKKQEKGGAVGEFGTSKALISVVSLLWAILYLH